MQNIDLNGFNCNFYETTPNAYKKRERENLTNPLDQFLKRVVTVVEPLEDEVEELTREVREVSLKRSRDEDKEKKPNDDTTQLKRCNNTVTEEDIGRNVFGKRTREIEVSSTHITLEDLIREAEAAPLIEEIPEVPPIDAFKTNQLALQVLTHEVCQKNTFIFACADGDLLSIKRYIIDNCFLLTELNQGIIAQDLRINLLLDGLNAAILNNKSHVVDFFLKLNAVRKNVHKLANLPLSNAFSANRLTIIYKLLQVPSVVRAITKDFIKSNAARCAKDGHLFQFIMLAWLPQAEKALSELGFTFEKRTIIDLVEQCAARFPKFAAAWKDFLATDVIQVSDSGPIIMAEKTKIVAILEQPILEEDLPDLSGLLIQ